MSKLSKIALSIMLLLGLSTVTANASVVKGQKLYSKKLKKACGFSGAKMAAKHSQDEWEEINDNGALLEEIQKFCPKVKSVKDKFLPHFYDFFYEYANDSGNVPSC
jgi:hypothetical protein